jgi:hypothetical protein
MARGSPQLRIRFEDRSCSDPPPAAMAERAPTSIVPGLRVPAAPLPANPG